MADRSRPVLEENTLRGNGWSGISFRSASGGSALRNIAEDNGNAGTLIQGTAAPRLVWNYLRRNLEAASSTTTERAAKPWTTSATPTVPASICGRTWCRCSRGTPAN